MGQLSAANDSRIKRIFEKVEMMEHRGALPISFRLHELKKHFVAMAEDKGEEMVTRFLELLDEELTREMHSSAVTPRGMGAQTIDVSPEVPARTKRNKMAPLRAKAPTKSGGWFSNFVCVCMSADAEDREDFERRNEVDKEPDSPGLFWDGE